VTAQDPPDLSGALDALSEKAGVSGPAGLLKLADSFPETAPPVRVRTSLASEKL
jgi:hypothetical protein